MVAIDQILGMLQATAGSSATSLSGTAAATGTAGVPFAGVMQAMMQQTATLDKKAVQSVTGLLDGSGVEVHDAMIATQKADMAFELALQVRNKAVGAYQQMLSMQF
ncbi:flagellar hook-basal body complex protein FliE [Granulicella arctica]|uniref:flagellar hook-basal body complex protein FliE n=1 Tax=Granulicella arctica TaxID=940613 RepID=UPI0021DFCCCE|nr:flagellar hook-basal body complex protein FliE [Granulicella arctica]